MVINFTVNSSVTHCVWVDVHCGFLPVVWKNINWRPALSSLFPGILNETTSFTLNKYILHLHIQHQVLSLDSTKFQLAPIFIFLLSVSFLFFHGPETYKALIISLNFFFTSLLLVQHFANLLVEYLQPQTPVLKNPYLGYFCFQGVLE